MSNKDLDIIHDDLISHHTNYNYRIEAFADFTNDWCDVTDMFDNPDLLKELKIKYRVIALNEMGYTQLLRLGFKKQKITKSYDN
jgi:hypothetical protein